MKVAAAIQAGIEQDREADLVGHIYSLVFLHNQLLAHRWWGWPIRNVKPRDIHMIGCRRTWDSAGECSCSPFRMRFDRRSNSRR